MKSEIRNSKFETIGKRRWEKGKTVCGFSYSNLEFISDLVFRISNFF